MDSGVRKLLSNLEEGIGKTKDVNRVDINSIANALSDLLVYIKNDLFRIQLRLAEINMISRFITDLTVLYVLSKINMNQKLFDIVSELGDYHNTLFIFYKDFLQVCYDGSYLFNFTVQQKMVYLSKLEVKRLKQSFLHLFFGKGDIGFDLQSFLICDNKQQEYALIKAVKYVYLYETFQPELIYKLNHGIWIDNHPFLETLKTKLIKDEFFLFLSLSSFYCQRKYSPDFFIVFLFQYSFHYDFDSNLQIRKSIVEIFIDKGLLPIGLQSLQHDKTVASITERFLAFNHGPIEDKAQIKSQTEQLNKELRLRLIDLIDECKDPSLLLISFL